MSDSRDGIEARDGREGADVAAALESLIGCKWSLRLLGLMARGVSRPSELQRACHGLSAKVLHERLRKMVGLGVVDRRVFGDKPPLRVDYVLTGFGERLLPILDEIRRLQEDLDRGEKSD